MTRISVAAVIALLVCLAALVAGFQHGHLLG
jgi:hypothetical protein